MSAFLRVTCLGAVLLAVALTTTPVAPADPGHGADQPHLQTEPQDDGGDGGGLIVIAVIGGLVVVLASALVVKRAQAKQGED